MGKILYDGLNLTIKAGTGISTYARNLANIASESGYEVSMVYSSQDKPDTNDVIREANLYEGQQRNLTKTERILNGIRSRVGLAQHHYLTSMKPKGLVIQNDRCSILPTNIEFQFGWQIFDRARLNFSNYGNFGKLLLSDPVDMAHFTFPLPLYVPKAINIYTIHDLVPLRLPYATLDRRKYFYNLHNRLIKTADHVVTVSESSRNDIIKIFNLDPKKVTNTYQSVQISDTLLNKSIDTVATEVERFFNLDYNGYFLYYGAIEPKKNVLRLLEAYLSSGLTTPLVLVSSSGWQNETELSLIQNSQARTDTGPRVKVLPYATYSHLVSLIRGARAVVFPSLYEGFGLPVLEAMTLGTPVLTSKTSSLGELAGDAAYLVDPLDVCSIRNGLQHLDRDAELRSELTQRGLDRAQEFSPAVYRTRIRDLYASLGC